jgi:hypothetical protein
LKKIALLAAISVMLVASVGAIAASAMTKGSQSDMSVDLKPVNSSGVSGVVDLHQRHHHSKKSGTQISVSAQGLQPANQYVSLTYDNHTCALEPYSSKDIIGGTYTANQDGTGTTSGHVKDNLNKIDSVSVRSADGYTLLACADVHPS